MKISNLTVTLAAFVLICVNASAQSFGSQVNINKGWRFCLDSVADYSQKANDSKWRLLDLPHDWSVESVASPELFSCTGYLPAGIGWYRKSIDIDQSASSLKHFLYFGGVYCNSEVWINGQLLGKRPNGYVSFMYDITPYVKFGGKNQIVVKVDHSKSADSRWYTGSGIYRDVLLVTSNPVHIDLWGLFAHTAKIETNRAEISVAATINNESKQESVVTVEHKLYRKGESVLLASTKESLKIPANTKNTTRQTLKVMSPKLWSVEHPALYRVETVVYENGTQIDGTTTITGIRETRFDPNKGFSLNGESMKLKGVCLHHDAGSLGAAVPKRVWERRLQALKEIGCNSVRMSHNPQSQEVYELCDELGIMVLDEAFDEWEFPKRKWLKGWNVGKSPGFQGYAEHFAEWGERDLADVVNRDKNHTSIIMWSIGNEVDYPNDPYSHPILDQESINQKAVMGYRPEQPKAERLGEIATKLAAVVKKIDTSRPVTGALAGVVMSNHTDYPFVLDVAGYNYTENRYAQDHTQYPERVLYGSENRHEYKNWLAVKQNDYICGQYLWTGIDYLGEAGPYPSRGFISGLLDLGGFKKARGYYRESLWSEKPMVFIGTIPVDKIGKKTLLFDSEPSWNYKSGELIRVSAFTNCENVALTLNGKLIRETPKRDEVSNALYWDIPYTAGVLRIEGFIDEELYAEYMIKTHSKADHMKAVANIQTLNGRSDLVHVELNILDKEGVRVLDANNLISCKVNGSGELLKLENANPSYTGSFMGNKLTAYRGRLLAYVIATQDSGTIEVVFTDKDLKETKVKVNIN